MPAKSFQPTLPARGATCKPVEQEFLNLLFQPTLPARGATTAATGKRVEAIFQPTLPARGATVYNRGDVACPLISTHAPRTGSDARVDLFPPAQSNFNPRSPHGERPALRSCPVRSVRHFNPRSPHGERRIYTHDDGTIVVISTHAPRTGSDPAAGDLDAGGVVISTHAPRTGSDRL